MRNLIIVSLFISGVTFGQVSKVWVADNGDGTYKNPIIHADYSDPDAIRVGDDYYMISSSFNFTPGLPILHSKDLVNWTLVGHALGNLDYSDRFKKVQNGGGIWAPAIRHHKGLFYIYFPDPDLGIFVTTAKDPLGDWSEPVCVMAGKGLIDPCPFWDEDGKAYLAYAFAGSRAGVKSVLMINAMNAEGTKASDKAVMVFDGQKAHPTIEGPKLHKRNGYYYISAPAGGVSTGWQLILRSKNIYGPYEQKIVLEQGSTPVNGPHQGAWVDTPNGEWWFLHFQDKDAYGRIVHLQPMNWKNDWPVMGLDKDGDGKGEPVLVHKKPAIKGNYPIITPPESDEFNKPEVGLQWQWPANRQVYFGYPTSLGYFRLNTFFRDSTLLAFPNMMTQKFPAEEFTATTKLDFSFNPKLKTEQIGFIVRGLESAWIGVAYRDVSTVLLYGEEKKSESEKIIKKLEGTSEIYFRIRVKSGGLCDFYYSLDGKDFLQVNEKPFVAQPGLWVGATVGYFASRKENTNDSGYANIDWFRIDK
jgi:beta-xylosidase